VKPLPVRRGRPVCVTLDTDAEQLLRAMAPNSKGLGALLSELIRCEALRRDARPQLLETLHEQQPETGITAEVERAIG
jgi:hypothetical protein